MHLLAFILAYLRRSGMSETRFGRLAVGDPRFISDLRRGRLPHDRTVVRIERWIADREDGE